MSGTEQIQQNSINLKEKKKKKKRKQENKKEVTVADRKIDSQSRMEKTKETSDRRIYLDILEKERKGTLFKCRVVVAPKH